MGWVWNPVALVGILAGLVAIAMAVVVFRARPGHLQNRLLALFFLMTGVRHLWGDGFRILLFGPGTERFVMAMGLTTMTFLLPLASAAYFLFICTLGGPVARFLRKPMVWVPIVAFLVGLAVMVVVAPDLYFQGLVPWRHMDAWQYDIGWLARHVLLWVAPAVDAIGIVVALTALREARTPAVRSQLRWIATAFVTYDVLTIAWFLLLSLRISHAEGSAFLEQLYFAWGPLNLLILTALLSYGILRGQLFDIDLRIKAGVRRGVVLAPFAVAFFVATETLADALPFPGYWAGLVGAGLVALAFAPIQRLAHRLVDRLFPGVKDTDTYRRERKAEVYLAALEGAYRDGRVTGSEEAVLSSLAQSLGLSPGQAGELRTRFVTDHPAPASPAA